MATDWNIDLLCLMLCQHRPARLDAALYQLLIEVPKRTGIQPRVILSPDRPTAPVKEVCQRWVLNPNVINKPLPFPLVSQEEGAQWIRGRNWMLDQVEQQGWKPRWIFPFDDDWLMGPGWDVHLPQMLEAEGVNSWAFVNLVLWDRVDSKGLDVNTRQRHYSPILGRHQQGWRHDTTKTDFLTKQCTELGNVGTAPFFMLDYGSIVPEERRAMYRKYVKAGKLCPYVKNYVRPPTRRSLVECLNLDPAAYYNWQLEQEGKIGNAKPTKCLEPGGSGGAQL